jgi:transcription-repair coupling factor (superfamily II helicase)
MNLSGLLEILEPHNAFRALVADVAANAPTARPLEVLEGARPFVLAALQRYAQRPLVVITARSERARQLAAEIALFSATPEAIALFAEPDPLFYERIAWTTDTIAQRLRALALLNTRDTQTPIVVTTIRALMQPTAPPEKLRAGLRTLRRGETIRPVDLLAQWVALGYEPEAVVETPGSFSRRGGIVDLWPPPDPAPTRLEFVGDEIASLRRFDPATQRSQELIEALTIAPATEALLENAPMVAEQIARWDLTKCHPIAANAFRQDREHLAQRERFRGVEYYLPYFYPQSASLLDHLPAAGWIICEDWNELEATAKQLESQAQAVRADLEARGEIPPALSPPYLTWEQIRAQMLERPRLLLGFVGAFVQTPLLEETPALAFAPGARYGGQIRKVADEVVKMRAENARVVIVTRQSERIAEILREHDVLTKPVPEVLTPPQPRQVVVVQGALSEGWRLEIGDLRLESGDSRLEVRDSGLEIRDADNLQSPISNLFLLTDAEIFGWSRPKPRRAAQRPRPVSPEAFFADLAVGDYVVHLDHGIGIFRGLEKVAISGPAREYLVLEYAQEDRLYVPVHQIDRLSRYVAPGGHTPVLHRLGTAEWEQVKARTKQAVQDIARDLLELYAAREVVTGHAFSPDSQWQHELEAAFPYVETEDQLTAVEAVKQDMERERPMDRLIVGDVGYGKTEVALRAAFKATMDGKQVAVLVPTTVLAQQHFVTFKERLAPFPLEVEMLSRFRSPQEQGEVIGKLKGGTADIVIGTHRLLSNDVTFKDLGLLIIDEEQRFGVMHKERLKQLRKEVDVLTLTATPIPRTLYMSLSGARDMSTIETPPEERLPIRTIVTAYDERLIRDAILRELDRGGQVFFVHNRVRGIQIIANQLRQLVPEATIAVAHGQMDEEQLEAVMSEFAAGRYDVLVCTTIIESGIDIPNANTMLINHADKFGLAQLYQLRGRVGRSAARAYAYFLYDKNQMLSAEAHARLQSIAAASELGAGFQIAMRDLEIRGAGELLGARQSGHIAAVGFDLYCRLLAHAIEEQRAMTGERSAPLSLAMPTIDLPIPAQIPEDYVPDSGLRLRLYRRLADITAPTQVEEILREFGDRFGPPPEPVKNLIYLLRVKIAAAQVQVATIALEDTRLLVRFAKEDDARAQTLQQRFGDRVRAGRDRLWLPGPATDRQWREHLLQVLRALGKDNAPTLV